MEETRTLVDVGNGVKITMPCDKLMSAMAQMQAVLDMAKRIQIIRILNRNMPTLHNVLQQQKSRWQIMD